MRLSRFFGDMVGEGLYAVLSTAARFMPPLYDSESPTPPPDQPESAKTERFCKECDTNTVHMEHRWVIEQETTIECTVCSGVWSS